jgi:uncharacterized membrane protein YccC
MEPTRPSAWQAFWQNVIRFQIAKINPWMALRNTIGVTAPLVVGAASGSLPAGLIVCTGALNVAFRDSEAPYADRARHMLLASFAAGLSVFAGSISARNPVLAVLLAGIWAFVAGLLISVSTPAGELGSMSLVMMVVYGAVPLSPGNAALAGLAAFAGALFQTLLSISAWPFHRYAPERHALCDLYLELSKSATAPAADGTLPPAATAQSIQAQLSLAALDRDRSPQSDRFRFLLSQAERTRLSVLALRRVRTRLERDFSAHAEAAILTESLENAASALDALGQAIGEGKSMAGDTAAVAKLEKLAEQLRQSHPDSAALQATINDARFQLDALGGQLRSAADVISDAVVETGVAPERGQPRVTWVTRFRETLASLRANLNLDSAACRHAIRLSVCIAVGDAVGRSYSVQRHYWIPMTIAIVLRPDFSATFSRGILRLIGTLVGVVLATGLFHLWPDAIFAHIAVIAVLMFLLRCFGGANYGVFATVITAIVVFLISLSGVAPGPVMAARAFNTAVGGALALFAYWVWPTWERHQVSETLARMLDAFRAHFRAIRDYYTETGKPNLDRTRADARLARSNFEASLERAVAEPGVRTEEVTLLGAILASSHRLARALLSLEASIANTSPVPPRKAFLRFANDVELTLYYLGAVLRGSPARESELPDLREVHHALVRSGGSGDDLAERYALVNVETDRITNGLNTLAGEVFAWVRNRPGQESVKNPIAEPSNR